MLVGGFYREWARHGDSTQKRQLYAIKLFTDQIEKATRENKNVIILGDALNAANKAIHKYCKTLLI